MSTLTMSLDGELLVNGFPDGVSMNTMPFGGGELNEYDCWPFRYVPVAFAMSRSWAISASVKMKELKTLAGAPGIEGWPPGGAASSGVPFVLTVPCDMTAACTGGASAQNCAP